MTFNRRPVPARTSPAGGIRRPVQRTSRQRNASSDRMRATQGSLPQPLKQRIDEDPLFRVITSNRSHWIDPFTGAAIPIPESIDNVPAFITQHLLASDSWRRDECLDMMTLSVQCWRLELRRLLRSDKRFRLFSNRDGAWMNPYTGNLVDEVQRPQGGRIDQSTITNMARCLAYHATPFNGEPLSPEVLRQAMGASTRDRNDERSDVFAPIEPEDNDLSRDLERATAVQARMMLEPPLVDGYEIARVFQPHSAVSGDAYDLHLDEDGILHFIIADVAGHGLQGALISAGLLRTVRLLRRSISDPRELLIALNAELKPELLPGQFITVCVGRLDPQEGSLQVCLAGHHPCLVINPGADIMLSRLGKPGLVLGVADGEAFASTLRIDEIALSPGDLILQFTDGIIEASDGKDEFGVIRLASRLLRRRAAGQDASALLEDAVQSASRFAGGKIGDDVTMIAIGRYSNQ